MIDSAHSVGKRLRLFRKALGLKGADICRTTGFSSAQWAQYETGKRRISLEAALTLAKRYGVTLDYIFLGVVFSLPKDIADKLTQPASAATEATNKPTVTH